ncbi:MAG TPA: hypothetical protein HA254_03190 [Candidatus Diapherotrites archaeon]|uniref:tRNA pseudouridine(55) synthase n=1 Tax=Candidatus Iainarchaeum sp. TaxID=3101447 RepID=A0A7J4IVU7_9ARCH|nr:hypothetical protein [Candidatus Diapherotrites archaeon]
MNRTGFKDLNESEILDSVRRALEGLEFSTFGLGVCAKDALLKLKIRESAISYISSSYNAIYESDNHNLYALIDLDRGIVEARPSSVYIEGRYNKYSRKIAQTFHYCFRCKGRGCSNCNFTGKLSELSVQEILEQKLLAPFGSGHSKFHGAGREDVDVLMLGAGRPFIFEALDPKKRSADLKALEDEINSAFNGLVGVHSLSFAKKERIEQLKSTPFEKVYSALCSCGEKISPQELNAIAGKAFDVAQMTPERVSKRRVEKERSKSAKVLSVQLLNDAEFRLEILASHGLYVKEFISGDGERTKPSVSSLLGKKCACKELDVIEVRA